MWFQCVLSSGILYWQNLVWRSLGQFTCQHATHYAHNWYGGSCLNRFNLSCNPKYTKTMMVLISKACTEWWWSTHMFEEQDWYPLQNSKLQVKAEFSETCPLDVCGPAILSFQTDMDATLLNCRRMCLCACACTLCTSACQCTLAQCKGYGYFSGTVVFSYMYVFNAFGILVVVVSRHRPA